MSEQISEPATTGQLTGIPLSKLEYKELTGIVKNRTTLVLAQLGQREKEVKEVIKAELDQEYEAAITKYRTKGQKLRAKYDALQKEIKELQSAAAEEGLSMGVVAYYEDDVHIEITNRNAEVNRRFEQLKTQKGAAEINLKLRAMEALETLALGQLSSPEARQLLQNLPTIEELLPVTTQDVRRLTTGK